ncbi:MAG: hypothetical protein IT340_03910 [Chloroflexi bacterium]|nr:hypothetical protein [Chloroflexota bacterium]
MDLSILIGLVIASAIVFGLCQLNAGADVAPASDQGHGDAHNDDHAAGHGHGDGH